MKKDLVGFADFAKLDLRVGEVITCEEVTDSRKLIKLQVDLGPDYGTRTIFAGLLPFGYTGTDLAGKKFIFLANLEPKDMPGGESVGMMLAADDGEKAIVLPVADMIPNGAVVR